MDKKFGKQILYIIGYLTAIFLILLAVYLIWFKPAPTCKDNRQNQEETGVDCGGPCKPCEIKALSPVEVSFVKHFPAGEKTILLAEIKNPNPDYGADGFSFYFDIYADTGEKIKRINGKSFIYAGEIKYIFETIDIDYAKIGKTELTIADSEWKSTEKFPKPQIQVRDAKTEKDPKNSRVFISGTIKNNNAFSLKNVKILSVLSNPENIQISASKTELENIGSFEEKRFKITLPANISLSRSSSPVVKGDIFTRDLAFDYQGEDVKKLQEFLRIRKFFDHRTTTYFGHITQKALADYQKSVGISPAVGYFGPKTRTLVNAEIKNLPPTTLLPYQFTEADANKTKIYVEATR
ncbi:peptidoglycan-binding protein [Candidatus Wolfebacteria bacterium]|nr:peptidoglycan-binding protein [Candidatus Wolfebacteria bacterium]